MPFFATDKKVNLELDIALVNSAKLSLVIIPSIFPSTFRELSLLFCRITLPIPIVSYALLRPQNHFIIFFTYFNFIIADIETVNTGNLCDYVCDRMKPNAQCVVAEVEPPDVSKFF